MVRLSRDLRIIDIEPRIPELLRYFERNGDIVAVYLYGSYGTERQTALSDVDLGVLLRRGLRDKHLERFLDIQAAVAAATREEDVNVLILNNAPPVIQFEVLRSGRLIFERDGEQHRDFVEHVIKRYPDFAIDFQAFCRDYDASLREAYLRGRQE